jgi:hypothetical protein
VCGVFPPPPPPPPPPTPPFFRSRFFSLPCALSLSRGLFFSDDPPRRRDTPLNPSRKLSSAFSIESLQLSPPPSSPSPSSSPSPAPPSPLASSSELAWVPRGRGATGRHLLGRQPCAHSCRISAAGTELKKKMKSQCKP